MRFFTECTMEFIHIKSGLSTIRHCDSFEKTPLDNKMAENKSSRVYDCPTSFFPPVCTLKVPLSVFLSKICENCSRNLSRHS